ncbi:hypothetical protein PI23P_06096 [Polaribacter irgensii 23-P]|uniref:Uncharacterized protein n=2 Tax=Polaribacter TaxID=52959 RepID=A4C318_9FLAO|nr:hypothetical protein PI23P_06096 [Polaribacter irgensii 23-P]
MRKNTLNTFTLTIKIKKMKNLFIYYLTILLPLGILNWLSKTDLMNPTLFVLLLFFYALIFRTYVDGKRLADKNIIQKQDIWKMIIPGKRFKYFSELYLKKKLKRK